MAPLLVVEHETFARSRPEAEDSTCVLDIACRALCNGWLRAFRFRIRERLPGVVEGLRVHILVAPGELDEIWIRIPFLNTGDEPLGDLVAIREGVLKRWKRETPARGMSHLGRVVEPVGILQDRGPVLARVPQAPPLLEPADMADLPARRGDGREARTEFAVAVPPLGDPARVGAGGAPPAGELPLPPPHPH